MLAATKNGSQLNFSYVIQNKLNKHLFLFIVFSVFIQFSYGQKTEINFNAYTGLFSFHGDGSTSNSTIITENLITDNPYGRKNEFSYAIELQGQRLSKRKNIYGLGISFESLTSKVNINYLLEESPAFPNIMPLYFPATGETELKNMFITLNPFIGHRYLYRKMTFDLLAGFDAAFCLESKEAGNATINQINFLSSSQKYFAVENDKTKPSIDFRPRIQIKTQIKKFGFLVGYSLGLTNYLTQNYSKAYTNFLRLGLSYQLK